MSSSLISSAVQDTAKGEWRVEASHCEIDWLLEDVKTVAQWVSGLYFIEELPPYFQSAPNPPPPPHFFLKSTRSKSIYHFIPVGKHIPPRGVKSGYFSTLRAQKYLIFLIKIETRLKEAARKRTLSELGDRHGKKHCIPLTVRSSQSFEHAFSDFCHFLSQFSRTR